ncbi:sensor histidine kinase [Streptomyces sp. NPDC001515]
MSDSVFPARSAPAGHRRRRPPLDTVTLHVARRAVALPLVLLATLLATTFALRAVAVVDVGWLLAGLVCGLSGVVAIAAREARAAARAAHAAVEKAQASALATLEGAAAAVGKSLQWSAEELCRGGRPPLREPQVPSSAGPDSAINHTLGNLQAQAIAALIRVHDRSQSSILLEVLRRLAEREHALVGRALGAISDLEKQTDDPDLLDPIFKIDHLVTRMRRQVESTAVLGGQSLRSTRRPVPVTTVLQGALSEVVQYPRVAIAVGPVGVELGLPGHVGPDLTHLLAELIENACECSDPSTRVTVRAQRVAVGLAVEVEDRAVRIAPQVREHLNRLLKAPDQVDVSRQVRNGQLGLLVAAKIAQSHGMSALLQENTTGGTTALVVIPARLLVPMPPVEGAGAPSREASSPTPPARQAATAPASTSAGRSVHSGPVSAPGHGAAGQTANPPKLPTRSRQPGAFTPPSRREQVPTAAPTPGLAGAFRAGLHDGATAGTHNARDERPSP